MIIYFVLLLGISSTYASELDQRCVTWLKLLSDEKTNYNNAQVFFNTNGSNFLFKLNNSNKTIRIICENHDRTAYDNNVDAIRITYYEDKDHIKKTIWSYAKGNIQTIIITDHSLLLNLFCIRTFGDSDYYFKNRIKYISTNAVKKYVEAASFNILEPIPNDLIISILLNTDFHFLFSVLPLVSKRFYSLVQCFDNINNDRTRFIFLLHNIIFNPGGECNVPVQAFHDSRFSEKIFKEKTDKTVKEFLDNSRVKIVNGYIISLKRHEDRTPTEHAELLEKCIPNCKKYTEEILR